MKEAEIAVGFAPEDNPLCRINLGVGHLKAGRLVEAEKLFRQAYPHASDIKGFVETYERLLNRMEKFKEAEQLNARYWELEEVYSKRHGY